MVTGIECVGLILAVMPIFIEAAKSYKKGVDTIRDVVSPQRRDDRLEDFYEDLWWEMFLIDRQIREVVQALPCLSDSRKTELTAAEHMDEWTVDADVTDALHNFLRSDSDFLAFMLVMTKIVQLLAQIVKDTTVRISEAEMDSSRLYYKLKDFERERRLNKTSSTFGERLRFWRKEKDRVTCLRALRTWNKRLLSLTDDARKEPIATKASTTNRKGPSQHLRMLSKILYRALAKYWTCNCPNPHEARFCIKPRDTSTNDPEKVGVDFDFLFSATTDGRNNWSWQEGTVLVRPKGYSVKYDSAVINRICDALNRGVGHGCLHFLVEDIEEEQMMWQLRPQPKRLSYVSIPPAISLQSLLLGSTRLPLVVKRRLALILANSLLQLHEGVWRSRDWSKGQITFFYKSAGDIDFQRPYVTPCFETPDQDVTMLDFDTFHRNPSILTLGILLIEIHTGNPIETYRSSQDLTNGREVNANTDWAVADRVVKSLDDCSLGYRGAIQACLDTSWLRAGRTVSLEDPITRSGVYNDIVQPLEDELQYLFREKF